MHDIIGKFWFSRRQRKLRDGRGDARIFCFIPEEEKTMEYTEMAPLETLLEEPDYVPLYSDAEYLGEGWFNNMEV